MKNELIDYSVLDFEKMNLRITQDRRLDFDTSEVVKQLCEARGGSAPDYPLDDVKGSDVELMDFMLMHLYREKQAIDKSLNNEVLEKYSVFQQTQGDIFSKQAFERDDSRIATLKVLGAITMDALPLDEHGMPGEELLDIADNILSELVKYSEEMFGERLTHRALISEEKRRIIMSHFAETIIAKRNSESVFEVFVNGGEKLHIYDQSSELQSIVDRDGLSDLIQKAGAATITEHANQIKLGCKAFFDDHMVAYLLLTGDWQYFGNGEQGIWLPEDYDFTEFKMLVEDEDAVDTAVYNRGAVEAIHLYNYGRLTMYMRDIIRLLIDIEKAAKVDDDLEINFEASYEDFAVALNFDYSSYAIESPDMWSDDE